MYPTIFLTRDSNTWNPYNETYKLNEDSFLDFRGELCDNLRGTKRPLLNVDVSATNADDDYNDVADTATDNVTQLSWRENMLRKRLVQKRSNKLQKIDQRKENAIFELSLASAMLKDAEPRITENTTDYTEHDFDQVPVLPPPIPQPEGWGPLSDVSHEDYVMIGSAVATLAEEEMP